MKSVTVDLAIDTHFVVVNVVEHLPQIYVEAIDLVSHHRFGCVDGNVIGILDQLDVRRRCWKVGQIVIDERWRQNSTLCHSCIHLSVFIFFLPKMNLGSSVLHIVVEPATDCCMLVLKTQSSSCRWSTLWNAAVRSSTMSTVR